MYVCTLVRLYVCQRSYERLEEFESIGLPNETCLMYSRKLQFAFDLVFILIFAVTLFSQYGYPALHTHAFFWPMSEGLVITGFVEFAGQTMTSFHCKR